LKKAHPELVKYIEKELARDVHIDAIKKVLLDVGHDPELVQASISHVHKRHKTHRAFYGFLIVAVLIAVLVVLFLGIGRPSEIDATTTTIMETTTTIGTTTTSTQMPLILPPETKGKDAEVMKKVIATFNPVYCLNHTFSEEYFVQRCYIYANNCRDPEEDYVEFCEEIKNEFEE